MTDRARGFQVVDITHTLLGERGEERQSRPTRGADGMPEGMQRAH